MLEKISNKFSTHQEGAVLCVVGEVFDWKMIILYFCSILKIIFFFSPLIGQSALEVMGTKSRTVPSFFTSTIAPGSYSGVRPWMLN
jgi:hypothetical protein